MNKRRSAFSTLSALPPVFSLKDLAIELGRGVDGSDGRVVSTVIASKYCSRWKDQGMIKPAGPNAGVFYNIVRDPRSEQRRNEALVKAVDRKHLLIGISAIHDAGWTTQIPHEIQLALPTYKELTSLPTLEGFKIVGRPAAWFEAIYSKAQPGHLGIPSLPPEHALVDMIAIKAKGRKDDILQLDPDDIDLDFEDPVEMVGRIFAAADDLKISREIVEDYLARVSALRGFFDEIEEDDEMDGDVPLRRM